MGADKGLIHIPLAPNEKNGILLAIKRILRHTNFQTNQFREGSATLNLMANVFPIQISIPGFGGSVFLERSLKPKRGWRKNKSL
jgi:hypothetical protein